MDISHINWLAVTLATVLAFALGALWYGPLFGKSWQQMMKLSDDDIANVNPAMLFGPAFVLTFIQTTALAALLPPGASAIYGAIFGAIVCAALIASSFGVNYLFSRHPRALWGIDAGFNIVQGIIMGGVLGAWG